MVEEKAGCPKGVEGGCGNDPGTMRSEEHTSELQSRLHLVCRLLLEKKKIVGRILLPMARHSKLEREPSALPPTDAQPPYTSEKTRANTLTAGISLPRLEHDTTCRAE